MAAKVEEEASCLVGRGELAPPARELRPPTVETGLEPKDTAERLLADQPGGGEEVAVPAAVLKNGQQHVIGASGVDELLRLGCPGSERLVDYHRDPGLDRSPGQRHVDAIRSCDHDQLEVARSRPDLIVGLEQLRVRKVALGSCAALRIATHDRTQLEPVHGRDQRRMEHGSREAVAEERHADRPTGRAHVADSCRREPFGAGTSRLCGVL